MITTIEELKKIQEESSDRVNQGSDRKTIRIGTCMATGGIAAKAQSVLDAINDELTAFPDLSVQVVPKGCVGMCRLDPLVDVLMPGEAKVTYVKMTAEKIRRVIHEHVIGGNVVDEYTLQVANDRILNDYVTIED